MSKPAMANFLHALAAVLGGNAVYFLLLPYLPRALRHAPDRMDAGVAVDFLFCLLLLGLIKLIAHNKRPHQD